MAKSVGRAPRPGRALGSCNPLGVGFPRIQNSPGLFPFICFTGEETEAQKRRSPSEFVGEVGLKASGSDAQLGLFWAFKMWWAGF